MKTMKKLGCCLGALALVASATSAFGNVISGSWDLNTGLNNGSWTETFNPTPGSAGSVLAATDGTQWNMFGFTSLGAVAAGGGAYDTTYINGTVNLGSGPWGSGGTISGMTLNNVSTFTQSGGYSYLTFNFSATGTYLGELVTIAGSFTGDNNVLNGLGNYSISGIGQNGNPFNTLSISVVPDGGGTVLLLGAALSTIGFLRRKLLA